MTHVVKSVLVHRPPPSSSRWWTDCERYPEFLPWCTDARCSSARRRTRARLDIDYHGLKTPHHHVNRNHRPSASTLDAGRGPFEEFRDTGASRRWAMRAAASSSTWTTNSRAAPLAGLLRPAFAHILETLVDRFVARAESR
jgi:ribosome-associated toxin RatA of RatAB toxin-antitoxin module